MIFFVRHGETDFNLFNISQGQLDTSLNETGLLQAKKISKKLRYRKVDVIFCSTLKRARQTLFEIRKYHKCKIFYDDRLMEVSKGILQAKNNTQEDYDKFFKNPHAFGGETEEDVYKRVFEFLEDIKKYKGKNILIVGHGGIHKYLDFCLKGKNLNKDKLILTHMENCEVAKFKF